MGKKAPEPPPVPDPAALVAAQARANRISQFTPQGNLLHGRVSDDGSFAFDPSASTHATMVTESPFQQELRALQEAIGRVLAGLRGRAERAAYRRALDLLEPEIERQENRLRQSLANRGLPVAPGSAGGDEYGRFLDAGNRARQDVAWAAVAQGGAEADRAFDRAAAARDRAFAERAALRRQQFNELAALLGGQQIAPAGLPSFAPAAPVDVLGANALAQRAGLDRYNAEMQRWNGFQRGLGGALGRAIPLFAR